MSSELTYHDHPIKQKAASENLKAMDEPKNGTEHIPMHLTWSILSGNKMFSEHKIGDTNPNVRRMLTGFSLVHDTASISDTSGVADGKASKPGDQRVKGVQSETKTLDPRQFAHVAKRVLAKLSPSGGGVSKKDLAKALEDSSFKGDEAQALAAMYDSFDSLSHIRQPHKNFKSLEDYFLANPATTSESQLSPKDLDAYQRIRPEQEKKIEETRKISSWAKDNFDRYAHDGSLSRKDIQMALGNRQTPESDKKVLTLIDKHFDEMVKPDTALKQSDFDRALDSLTSEGSESNLVWRIESICRRTAKEAQPSGEVQQLYATRDPLESIKPAAVRQGSIGDCFFDCALASVAKTHPEMIRNAIKQNADKTYTVTFPGAADKPVTVKAPTEAELGLYNGAGGGDGVWPLVMEKAFGELRKEHPELSFSADSKDGRYGVKSGTPEDSAGGGGDSAPCITLLTGHDSDVEKVKESNLVDMDKRFRKAFATGNPKAVTAEIKGDFSQFFGEKPTTSDGFFKQHAYTIIDYVTSQGGGPYIVVRNPWGGKNGTTSGTITVSLSEFMSNFDTVSFEI